MTSQLVKEDDGGRTSVLAAAPGDDALAQLGQLARGAARSAPTPR
jgi:hypothetical protein